MNVAPHLIRLYNKTSRRYRKLLSKLQRDCVSGWQRKSCVHELQKLLKRLRELNARLKVAAATGAVVMLLHTTPANAQTNPPTLGPFVLQNRLNNPLREALFSDEGIITVVDFDGDGDEDVVLGQPYNLGGRLRYFENKSSEGSPLYLEREDEDNPLYGIYAETHGAAPAFADVDGDGDLDLFLGQNGYYVQYTYPDDGKRGIEYYRNDDGAFTRQTGAWDGVTKMGNPFDGFRFGNEVSPVFVDMDHDGDQDLVVGSFLEATYPYYDAKYITYYENDGDGDFAPGTMNLTSAPSNSNYEPIYPTLTDLDGDGDYDMVVGSYYDGYIRYYQQVAPGEFQEEQDEWDPDAKTGNPFFNYGTGRNASVAFVDFNNDDLIDLFVADQLGSYITKYSDNIIDYFINKGDNVFEQPEDLENPFGGVFVKQDAAPVLADMDGDGDLDAVIGNKYSYSYYGTPYSYLTHYRNNNGVFTKLAGESNPLDTLEVYGNFAPQIEDVDGDNDLDIITGNYYGEAVLFQNQGGFFKYPAANPFAGLAYPYYGSVRLADIDGDGDLDLFMANYGTVYSFRNTGTDLAPVYEELTGTDNPLYSVRFVTWGTPFLHFADLDHDGDLDLVFNGANPDNIEDDAMVYMENTGTREVPEFEMAEISVFSQMDAHSSVFLVDYDGDGDLDAFAGIEDGIVNYLENQNPAVVTAFTSAVARYDPDGDPVIIDAGLTLTDADSDTVVYAVVAIQNFQAGETLSFTPQAGITGTFDNGAGVLTLRGKAPVADYQAILRSVLFEIVDTGGRKRPAKKSIVDKTIAFSVYDVDATTPQLAAKSLQILVNDPPVINAHTLNLSIGGSTTFDLKSIISDPNGSADVDLATLQVIQAPGSGAAATIDASGILTIDYSALTFTGSETIVVQVCDADGLCGQNTLTINVTNTPPVITPEPVSTVSGHIKTINLLDITSDVDNNLDPNSFTVITQPSSGAKASIDVVSDTEANLILDYRGITLQGTDELSIRACDRAGACSESALAIVVDVVSAVVVYNAVAPNSTGDNKFMRIEGLPPGNKVSIFNRWGDRVFDVQDYRETNAFNGLNDHGNTLPSGTYFYRIEGPGLKMVTGYLHLKQ